MENVAFPIVPRLYFRDTDVCFGWSYACLYKYDKCEKDQIKICLIMNLKKKRIYKSTLWMFCLNDENGIYIFMNMLSALVQILRLGRGNKVQATIYLFF